MNIKNIRYELACKLAPRTARYRLFYHKPTDEWNLEEWCLGVVTFAWTPLSEGEKYLQERRRHPEVASFLSYRAVYQEHRREETLGWWTLMIGG